MSKYELDYHPVEIGNGEVLSGKANVGYKRIVGFVIPTGFQGTTIGLEANMNVTGGSYRTVVDPNTGNAESISVAANSIVPVQPAKYIPLHNVRIKAGTAQTSDVTVYIITSVVD